jgi:hypothetical protein
MADLLDDHQGASSGSLEQEDDLAVSASDVSEDELGEFEPTEHAQRLQRLAADKELLETLQRQGLHGRDRDRFVEVLARYGLDVMRAWVHSGEVFAKCLQRGWGSLHAPSDDRPWGMDEAEELSRRNPSNPPRANPWRRLHDDLAGSAHAVRRRRKACRMDRPPNELARDQYPTWAARPGHHAAMSRAG